MEYGYGYYSDCAVCCGEEPEFQSPEGLAKRREALRYYGILSKIQMPLSVTATLSGATSIGLAIPNPSYPYLSCFPFVSGVMMFIAGYFGYKASLANVESEVPRFVKRNITVHYVLCVTCCSFCALAASFAGWALALCFQDNEDLRDQCLPVRDVKMAFTISDIVLNTFLTVISIIGTVFFCKYMRTFGLGNLVNRFQQLEREVQDLRAQLAVASSQAPTENRNQVHPLSSTTGGKPGEKNLFVEYGIIDKTAY